MSRSSASTEVTESVVVTREAEVAALGLLLGRLERLNESVVAGICSRRGLSPGELRVLAMLRHSASGADDVRPTEISRWVVQTTGGLTATLSRLEAAGRVVRRSHPTDGRGRMVVLTPEGREFYEQVLADLTERYQIVLGSVDVGSSTAVVRTLIDAFERAAGLTPTGEWDLARQLTEETR